MTSFLLCLAAHHHVISMCVSTRHYATKHTVRRRTMLIILLLVQPVLCFQVETGGAVELLCQQLVAGTQWRVRP